MSFDAFRRLLVGLLAILPVPALAAELPDTAELAARLDQQQLAMDHVWTLVAAALVLMMQAGFLLLEAGMVRSKNSISVAQKNIADFLVATSCFYLVGFGLMFGASAWGWIGTSHFAPGDGDPWGMTFLVFQMMFCGTAATIVSGAVAERMTFASYLVAAAIIGTVIYPVFGHWAWGNLLEKANAPWLAGAGFIDFAGSTVVHSVGAWVALAAIMALGPRHGRFDAAGRPQPITGHSPVLATTGVLLLWVGWLGFNGGSTTMASPQAAKIILNTILAGAFGGGTAMLLGYARDGLFRPDRTINGVIAGLVGITAGCDAVSPPAAVVIGIVTAILALLADDAMERRWRVDDAIGAIAPHGFGGAIGTILTGALAGDDKLLAGSRLDQVLVQLAGVGIAFVWAFGCGWLTFRPLAGVIRLRVSLEDEIEGLNVSEHGTTLGTGALRSALDGLVRGDARLSHRLDESTGDEAAELATLFNRLLLKLEVMVTAIGGSAQSLVGSAHELRHVSGSLGGASAQTVQATGQISELTASAQASATAISQTMRAADHRLADVSGRAGEVSTMMQDMAGQIDGLVQAVGTIVASTRQAASLVAQASESSQQAIGRTGSLEQATGNIVRVLDSIRQISGQTRILALNASIEAQRAGVAGRGFAVLAQEVRQLATATEAATLDAEKLLGDVLASSHSVSDAIGSIHAAIQQVDQATVAIDRSVQLQDGAIRQIDGRIEGVTQAAAAIATEMAEVAQAVRGAAQAAQGASADAGRVADRILTVGEAAGGALLGAKQVERTAGQIGDIAAALDGMVGRLQAARP